MEAEPDLHLWRTDSLKSVPFKSNQLLSADMNYLGSTQKKTNVTFLCSSNKMYSHYSPLSQKKLLLSVYAANSNLPAPEASVNIPYVLWKEQSAMCSTHTHGQ